MRATLREVATTVVQPATENLAVRIDQETMSAILQFKEQFGKKTVATWLRNTIRNAVNAEKQASKK